MVLVVYLVEIVIQYDFYVMNMSTDSILFKMYFIPIQAIGIWKFSRTKIIVVIEVIYLLNMTWPSCRARVSHNLHINSLSSQSLGVDLHHLKLKIQMPRVWQQTGNLVPRLYLKNHCQTNIPNALLSVYKFLGKLGCYHRSFFMSAANSN